MSTKRDFNKVVESQLENMIALEADYSEITVSDSGYELSITLKRLVEDE